MSDSSNKSVGQKQDNGAVTESKSSQMKPSEVLAEKPTKEDLIQLLFLLTNLSLTSHALQTTLKAIFGKTYGELSFHAGALLSFIVFSFTLSDNERMHRKALEVTSVLQAFSAIGARSLGALAALYFGEEPTKAAWAVHTVTSFPVLGLGGAVWLHWTSKFMDEEPTKAGHVAIKIFSCVALISVVKYLEPLMGDTLLRLVDVSPKITLLALALMTYILSMIFKPSIPSPSSSATSSSSPSSPGEASTPTRHLSILSLFTLVLALAMTDTIPPVTPASLTIHYQRFSPYGLVQIVDSNATDPTTRYVRLESNILGAYEVRDTEVGVGDTLGISDVLLDAVALAGTKNKKALILGIQSGASAKSLLSASYETTIVDARGPLISAIQSYLALPEPYETITQDPAIWMMHYSRRQEGRSTGGEAKFDVIVHDAFEGGELPARMYTMEFWSYVRSALDETGVLAVKYVGKQSSVTFKSTLNMLRKAFRSCRAFHSNPLDQPPTSMPDEITEIVIFCTRAPTLSFTKLPSSSTQFSSRTSSILLTLSARELDITQVLSGVSPDRYLLHEEDQAVIRMWGKDGVVDYWKMMRKRYPASIWYSY